MIISDMLEYRNIEIKYQQQCEQYRNESSLFIQGPWNLPKITISTAQTVSPSDM